MSKMKADDGNARGSPVVGTVDMGMGESIRILSGQMQMETDRIASLTDHISALRESREDILADLFDDIRLSHLECLQKIILHLTKLVESDYPVDSPFSNTAPEGVSTEVEHDSEVG